MAVREEGVTLVRVIEERCSSHMKEAHGDQFLMRCAEKCKELRKIDLSSTSQEVITKWIKEYSQAVLDLTFYEENQLVDSDFSEEKAEQSLRMFIKSLSQPENLVKKWIDEDSKTVDVLGEELTECLLWRKGALLYMYCATCMEQQGRPQRHLEHFIECSHDGVIFLREMLRVRGPLKNTRSETLVNDEATFKLLQKGVYSDTHVLALMYAGELCHWFETLANDDHLAKYPDFDPYTTGTRMLHTYIDVIIGPLKGQGWNTQRAQDLLTLLKTDKCSVELKQSTI